MSIMQAYDQWSSVYDTSINPTRDLEATALRNILDLKESVSDGSVQPPAEYAGCIERILEVGCGTGKNTIYFTGCEGVRVVFSVDLSDRMLERARNRLAGRTAGDFGEYVHTLPGGCKVVFRQADVLEVDDWKSLVGLRSNGSEFAEEKVLVDLVSFSLVLEHMKDLRKMFAKAAAVTRAGGFLYIGELHPLKQYAGSKPRLKDASGETTLVTCFTHHVSDFLDAAVAAGYRMLRLKEYFDDDDRGSAPRILAMLFQKFEPDPDTSLAITAGSELHTSGRDLSWRSVGMEVEICLSDVESALVAQRGGATSVELCSDRAGGGVTPAQGLVLECVRRLRGSVIVNVLVRPRVGDFVYSPAEVEVMLRDIEAARTAGADGVVVGALTPGGGIDENAMRRFREAAGPLQLTFHRAIDVSSETIDEVITKLARLGCDRVLSSGLRRSAVDGLENLAAMVKLIHDRQYRIRIVAAAGVNANNARDIVTSSGVHGVHAGSAVTLTHRNPSWWQWLSPPADGVSMGTHRSGETAISDMEFPIVDENLVRKFVDSVIG